MESIPYYIPIIANHYHKNHHISQNRNHSEAAERVVPCISKKQKCNEREFSNPHFIGKYLFDRMVRMAKNTI